MDKGCVGWGWGGVMDEFEVMRSGAAGTAHSPNILYSKEIPHIPNHQLMAKPQQALLLRSKNGATNPGFQMLGEKTPSAAWTWRCLRQREVSVQSQSTKIGTFPAVAQR